MQAEIPQEKAPIKVMARHQCRKRLTEEKWGTANLTQSVDPDYLVGPCNKCGVLVSKRKEKP